MTNLLDISDVAKLTGLTSRALRFYEARGLLQPVRNSSGRRQFGPAELERLHQIMAMKRAGLTLTQIQSMTARKTFDLRSIVAVQVQVLSEREREIATARELLQSILSRIERSEPIDVATFCSLIRNGESVMTHVKLDELTSQYMSAVQKEAFQSSVAALPAGFDFDAHNLKWKGLSTRIKAALPLDPASPQAQAFLDEWDELAQPFIAACSPAALEGVKNFHDHIEEWDGEVDSPFDAEVFRFHQEAERARQVKR